MSNLKGGKMTKKDFVARGSAWIQRAPEDGKDGVGITSADVVFAQSKSNTNPPADTDVWKTNVKELPLVDGYLWSGTKIVYSNSNGKSVITGKYCIGSTRDYTDIEELYYLSDSGDKIPTNVTFQPSFKPEKGKYLWTCIRYRFKAQSGSAENTNWVYSTPTCAGYFGDDGVSVQSSDVVFAIGESKTTAPATGWITNFGGLTLTEGKYVWTCTKTTLTDGDSYYTGAYCLGECYDFAQVEELYALSDSSTNPPKDAVFSSSYKVVKGKYLWSCVKVTYNNTNISYLNKKCVSYFPNDGVNGTNGTSFNLLGTAAGHMKTWVKPSPFLWNTIYLVDGVNGGYPMTYKITTEGVKSAKANVGDAYIIDGNLWVANTTEWVNVGNIQGAPGEPGEDGEDALNIELSTDKILFSWDSKNKIYDVATKDITLIVKQGNNIINIDDYTINFQAVEYFELGSNNKNIRTDGAADGYTYNIFVYSVGIAMKKYTFNASVNGKEQTVSYPASSCSVKMLITYNGITYTKIIAIEVSFVQMYGDLAWNTEQLSSTYGKLTNGFDGTLVQMETRVNQNAKKITLEATKTIGDKLEKSGVYIESGKILAKTNHFEVQNSNGDITFTIDKDGNLVSEGNASFKGNVTATSGNIGGLEIYNDSYELGGNTFKYKGLIYENKLYEGYIPNRSVNLNDRYIYVGYGDSVFGGYFVVGNTINSTTTVDGQTELSLNTFLVVELHTDNSKTMQSATAGRFTASSNENGRARALELNAYGGMENYAVDAGSGDIRVQNGDFRAENGAFIGVHRGNVTKIFDDYTLKKTDSTIICNNTTKDISIYLPSDAVVGTFYRIIKNGKTVTLQSENKNIGVVNNIDLKSSVSSGTAREWINCLFDGDCWNVEMSRS